MNTTCHDCQQPIATGEAAIRSFAFKQLKFHPNCLRVRLAVDELFVDPAAVIAGHSVKRAS